MLTLLFLMEGAMTMKQAKEIKHVPTPNAADEGVG